MTPDVWSPVRAMRWRDSPLRQLIGKPIKIFSAFAASLRARRLLVGFAAGFTWCITVTGEGTPTR